ncbi:hypothetical protein B9479_008333 [Cryptococcus floricola]|uniref:Uncharacterized protein n=1 Tax=Cryptococcus floricola TaxID=2591691 RepID=A0A5D3AJD2_9TREE|nr:hypothetical protein B9479_008333 [Cryptococcus floricola]
MASNGNNDIVAEVTTAFEQDVLEDHRSHLNRAEEQMFGKCSRRFHAMFREALDDPSHADDKALFVEHGTRNLSMVSSEVAAWSLISSGKTADHLEIEDLNELGLSVALENEFTGFIRQMKSFITNGDVSMPQDLITDYKAIKTDEEFEATAETTRAAVEHAIATSRTWGASRASGGRGDAASGASDGGAQEDKEE